MSAQAETGPSHEALLLIANSVAAALARAGVTDCDDPGEAIDVLREDLEARVAFLESERRRLAEAEPNAKRLAGPLKVAASVRAAARYSFAMLGMELARQSGPLITLATARAQACHDMLLTALSRHHGDDDPSAAPQPAAGDECAERCKRRHRHTTLTMTRDAAPDTGWHWSVTLPDGHLYDVSHGRMTFEQARADLVERGLTAFDAADTAWRAALAQPQGGA